MANEMFLIIPLMILIVVSALAVILLMQPINPQSIGTPYTQEATSGGGGDSLGSVFSDAWSFITGAPTGSASIFGLTLGGGFLAIIGILTVLGTVAGITAFGSGLNTASTMIIYKSVGLYAIWSIFSVMSLGYIGSIPYFGWLIYLVMTGFYSVGVFSQL